MSRSQLFVTGLGDVWSYALLPYVAGSALAALVFTPSNGTWAVFLFMFCMLLFSIHLAICTLLYLGLFAIGVRPYEYAVCLASLIEASVFLAHLYAGGEMGRASSLEHPKSVLLYVPLIVGGVSIMITAVFSRQRALAAT